MTGNHAQNPFLAIFQEVKDLILLQRDYYKLEALEKGSLFLGHMLLFVIAIIIACFSILCLSFALAFLIGDWLGSFVLAFVIMAAFYIFMILLVYWFRELLLINPMIKILRRSLFKEHHSKPAESKIPIVED